LQRLWAVQTIAHSACARRAPPPPTLWSGEHGHLPHAVLLCALIRTPYERYITPTLPLDEAAFGAGRPII
jgi:hypothetical protein